MRRSHRLLSCSALFSLSLVLGACAEDNPDSFGDDDGGGSSGAAGAAGFGGYGIGGTAGTVSAGSGGDAGTGGSSDGTSSDGTSSDGTSSDGTSSDGTSSDGTSSDGTSSGTGGVAGSSSAGNGGQGDGAAGAPPHAGHAGTSDGAAGHGGTNDGAGGVSDGAAGSGVAGTTSGSGGSSDGAAGTTAGSGGSGIAGTGGVAGSGATAGSGGSAGSGGATFTCDEVDGFIGCCDGNTLYYCNSSGLVVKNCPTACGWNSNKSDYECGFTGVDPSGTAPITCGGTSQGGGAGTGGAGGTAGAGGSSDGSGGTSSAGSGGAGGCSGGAVLINELSTSSASAASDEYVELFNPGPCDVVTLNWQLRYAPSSSTSSDSAYWTDTFGITVPVGGYLVIGGATYVGVTQGKLNNGLADAGGGVGLYDASGTRIDGVAWGTAKTTNPECETAPVAAATPKGTAIARIPNGTDTQDNAVDFQVGQPRTPSAPND